MSNPTFALGTFVSSKGTISSCRARASGGWPISLARCCRRLGRPISRQTGQGRFHFRRSEWEDLPSLYHIVNALADIELIELRAASLTVSEGSTDHSNQRIVGRLDPNKAMMAAALADVNS